MSLRTFIADHCDQLPGGLYPLADFTRMLRSASGEPWPRSRVVAELVAAGFTIGLHEKVYQVAGLAPRCGWRNVGGALVIAVVA